MKTINKIQSIIDYWNKIKTDKQYQKFVDMVKNTRFGTYGTISFYRFYFDNENEFKHLNEYHSKQFKKELENILQSFCLSEIYTYFYITNKLNQTL